MTLLERELELGTPDPSEITGSAEEGRGGLTREGRVHRSGDAAGLRVPIRGASGLGVTAGAAVLSYEV